MGCPTGAEPTSDEPKPNGPLDALKLDPIREDPRPARRRRPETPGAWPFQTPSRASSPSDGAGRVQLERAHARDSRRWADAARPAWPRQDRRSAQTRRFGLGSTSKAPGRSVLSGPDDAPAPGKKLEYEVDRWFHPAGMRFEVLGPLSVSKTGKRSHSGGESSGRCSRSYCSSQRGGSAGPARRCVLGGTTPAELGRVARQLRIPAAKAPRP